MQYQVIKLPSGLTILIVPMPQVESATVSIWVKTGSRYETPKINGLSHFLEHMVFKGSVKRPSAKAISEAVDAIGGEFNAATSKDWTNFYIKSAVKSIETAFDVLSDMVLNPLLKEEEIEREKGTIIQEIAMYEDTPMMHIGDVFENLLFKGNSLGWDPAGTAKTVKGISKSDFVRYRKMHYHPENMLVSVVGGITPEKALALVKKYFSGLTKGEKKNGDGSDYTPFISVQVKPQLILKEKKSDQAHLIFGYRADGRDYPGRYAQAVLAAILGGGMSSRMFTEVRERRGLAYAVRTSVERYQETGYLATYAGVDPEKVTEAIKVIKEEHEKLTNGEKPITVEELTKAKEYLKGHLALALEATNDVTAFFMDQVMFHKEVATPEEVLERIDKVTLKDVLAEAKRLVDSSGLNLAIIGPYEDSERFAKILKQ